MSIPGTRDFHHGLLAHEQRASIGQFVLQPGSAPPFGDAVHASVPTNQLFARRWSWFAAWVRSPRLTSSCEALRPCHGIRIPSGMFSFQMRSWLLRAHEV